MTVLAELPSSSARASLLVVPLGACEQHGPHLPVGTDTYVAEYLAAQLVASRDDAVLAPTLTYGASGEHGPSAGTLSIGTEVLASVLTELTRSARETASVVVVVNGHGGNADALATWQRRSAAEGDRVLAFSPTWRGDAHAGRTETSLLLSLHPSLVRLQVAEAGVTAPLAELAPRLRSEGVLGVSPNGVLGDPAGASAEEGEALLAELGQDLTRAVEEFLGGVVVWHNE